MKVRNQKITVRLTGAEREHLQEQAELVDLGVEPFVRNLIMGSFMKPRPREEWTELVRQMSGIANNINQIGRKVNNENAVAVENQRLILDMQAQIWAKLKEY
ncbi:MAG: plasmid mobilization relaxosome protein MobC [Oscillospiraceae bacterium]